MASINNGHRNASHSTKVWPGRERAPQLPAIDLQSVADVAIEAGEDPQVAVYQRLRDVNETVLRLLDTMTEERPELYQWREDVDTVGVCFRALEIDLIVWQSFRQQFTTNDHFLILDGKVYRARRPDKASRRSGKVICTIPPHLEWVKVPDFRGNFHYFVGEPGVIVEIRRKLADRVEADKAIAERTANVLTGGVQCSF